MERKGGLSRAKSTGIKDMKLLFSEKGISEARYFCTNLFQQQFLHLNGKSRTVEDWVKDDMLNPAFNLSLIHI